MSDNIIKNIRRAKIVATIGPSSSSREKIKELIIAGLNVVRLNMSHGSYEDHEQVVKNVREVSEELGQEVAILQDLQGPKIRVDLLEKELELKNGEIWAIGHTSILDKYPEYKDKFIPSYYKDLVADLVDGTRILFDDGNLRATAIKKDRDIYQIKILEGGILKSRKGINLPDINVSAPSFTDKDQQDLEFGIKMDIDYVAISFVRNRGDIEVVREFLKERKAEIPIVAKIEKPQAVKNIQEILDVSDVIMVARGDMGVEVGNSLVPVVQKKLITLCNLRGTPVITATQMLESMIIHSTPTRAEASDVANAVWDGSDALMLSAESASGKFPVESVKMMSSIIVEAEKFPKKRPSLKTLKIEDVGSTMMIAASLISENLGAKRILAMTTGGNSCQRLARFRPNSLVLGVTNSMKVVRKMCLFWGVYPYYLTDYDKDHIELHKQVIQLVKEELKLKKGDRIVVTRGEGKFFQGGISNSVIVETIE